MRNPGAFLEPLVTPGDRAVRHAEENELAVAAHGNAALSRRRAETAGADAAGNQ